MLVTLSLASCGADNKPAPGDAQKQPTVECGKGEACGDCECPEATTCYSDSEPCRKSCPEGGDKVGEYYCVSGLQFPCAEALANHHQQVCTLCGCWDDLYCNAGKCTTSKPNGTACGNASECGDKAACCHTQTSPDEDVCASKAGCHLGIGEDCKTNADCPSDGICTDNGFCTAGCASDADCGMGSVNGANICVTGDFNTFYNYFPGMPGVCVPICDRDDPTRDCSRWSGTCDINYGSQSWCYPNLP